MGRPWYDEAKYLTKKNTFNDFVDVARWLASDVTNDNSNTNSAETSIGRGITIPSKLSCEGRSAGETAAQMTFKVEFTPEADADLDRLFDFLLERAQTAEEFDLAQRAVAGDPVRIEGERAVVTVRIAHAGILGRIAARVAGSSEVSEPAGARDALVAWARGALEAHTKA